MSWADVWLLPCVSVCVAVCVSVSVCVALSVSVRVAVSVCVAVAVSLCACALAIQGGFFAPHECAAWRAWAEKSGFKEVYEPPANCVPRGVPRDDNVLRVPQVP